MAWFAKDKKWGDIAEKKVYAILKERGYKMTFPKAKDAYHDLIIDGKKRVEVKFDAVMDSTGNLGIEWMHNREKKEKGWGQKCDAHILIQFHNMDNAVVVDWLRFKKWLDKTGIKYPEKNTRNSKSTIRPVPVKDIPTDIRLAEYEKIFSHDYGLVAWEEDAIRGKRRSIEPSPSKQSTCVICREKIGRNELRINEGSRWIHLTCAASHHIVSEISLVNLKGFDILTNEQIEVAKLITKQKVKTQ